MRQLKLRQVILNEAERAALGLLGGLGALCIRIIRIQKETALFSSSLLQNGEQEQVSPKIENQVFLDDSTYLVFVYLPFIFVISSSYYFYITAVQSLSGCVSTEQVISLYCLSFFMWQIIQPCIKLSHFLLQEKCT